MLFIPGRHLLPGPDIPDVADFIGDSHCLVLGAKERAGKNLRGIIVFCGVHFFILWAGNLQNSLNSPPTKKVLLPDLKSPVVSLA